jgi:catechol 2,3-dioxygenase-like lactoylglutathione lyase family enzyme
MLVRVSTEPWQGIAQIDRIVLATTRLESMCDFYRRLGGALVTPTAEPADDSRRCVLDFLGIRLEVFEPGGRPCAGGGDERSRELVQLGFALRSADEVDELTRMLAAAGHRVLEPPHRIGDFGRYESVLLDPDGNPIKLSV